MAAGDQEKGDDFYARLGLKKECSSTELRDAYKKLALRWHPDRCSASGNSKFVEEAKRKFQSIQEAYSVLSDTNKRFLYDVGVYDSDDDQNGMGDFIGEMAAMMSRVKPNTEEGGGESFEELQEMLEEMFRKDYHRPSSSSSSSSSSAFASVYENPFRSHSCGNPSTSNAPPPSVNKRNSWDMSSSNVCGSDASNQPAFNPIRRTFSLGKEAGVDRRSGRSWRRRSGGRKQKIPTRPDASTWDGNISS